MPNIGPFIYYIEAFTELSTERINGGPIPFSSIVSYAKIYNEDIDEFLYIIRQLDEVYLEWQQNQHQSDKS